MTDEEIVIEYEAVLASEGEELKTCPACGKQTYRKHCPYCDETKLGLTGDDLLDDLFARIENDEDVDLEQLRPKFSGNEFVEVAPGS